MIHSYFRGLHDSLSLHHTLEIFLSLPSIRLPIIKCLLMNGLIFIGSIYLFNDVVKPLLWSTSRSLFSLPNTTPNESLFSPYSFLSFIYHILWVLPLYIITYCVNLDFYDTVAKEVDKYQLNKENVATHINQTKKEDVGRTHPRKIAEVIYRFCFIWIMIAQGWFLSKFIPGALFPMLGLGLGFVSSSFLFSFYAFDYKWSFRGTDLSQSFRTIELDMSYFFGWGTPSALITSLFSSSIFISLAIFATLLPFCLIQAIVVNKQVTSNSNPRKFKLSFLKPAEKIMAVIIVLLQPFLNKNSK